MSAASDDPRPVLVAGRYALYRRIASGGMASVHYGRLFGAEGFSRVVAIKRLHPQLATDSAFVAAFVDEARLASRIRHPNVVQVLDVVASGDELLLVMEYVHGEKLSTLIRLSSARGQRAPLPVAVALIADALHGLHAAHEASSADGQSLSIVHRDVSPQNILVSSDGVTLVADFGIAKAVGRSQTTREGQIKGKLAYMAYEQLSGDVVDRRTDVWAACIVLWELLTGEQLFSGDSDAVVYSKIMQHRVISPRERVPEIPTELEAIVLRGLARKAEDRPATALELAEALARVVRPATRVEVSEWVKSIAGDALARRRADVAEIERLVLDADGMQTVPERVSEPAPSRAESTQVSTGVAAPALARAARRPSFVVLSLGALGLLALAAVWFLGRSTPAELTSPEAPQLASAPATTLEPFARAEPTPAPTASATGAAAPRAKPRPVPRKPAKPQNCRVLGADGIWRIRPGCL